MKFHALALALCLILLPPALRAQSSSGAKLSMSQLEQLLGPIALYPDPLLAQILPASTYPLEIVDAARIIHGSGDFSKIDSQSWDPSVKAVAHYPSTLKMMNDKLDWTQRLGQAVINQQPDVMQAIQNLRAQAQQQGNLKSTAQQKVSTDSSNKIEIVPANPEVVYVPTYDPTLVYSTSAVAAVVPLMTFSAGLAMGAWLSTGFYWGGNTIVCCGGYWGPHGWNNVTINNYNINNNTWNRNTNINNNTNNWQHDYNRSNPTTGRSGNLGAAESPFAKNHGSGLGGGASAQSNLQSFQRDMAGSRDRQANANMFGDRGDRNFGGEDSFRGFQSRGGGGGFGRFGGGGFGGGGFHGGGGFRR
ncbi:MAG TPA: DUF3300 domain-containing protein [bacterium]|nr:DUF3300 domain-containing protein [bacterium]